MRSSFCFQIMFAVFHCLCSIGVLWYSLLAVRTAEYIEEHCMCSCSFNLFAKYNLQA